MKLRLFIVALLIGLFGALTTLPLHSIIQHQALQLRALGLDPTRPAAAELVGLNVLALASVVFGLLYFVVGLPLSRAEAAVARLAEEDVELRGLSGPLTSRLERALRTMNAALRDERDRNARQLADLKATNHHLARLQAELVAADRMATVGKLAAGVAHEVGNPLAGILGYVSVLKMRAPAETVEVLDRVELEVQRIDTIVRSLLELGRPSRGKAQPVDVRPTIDSAVRLLGAGREFNGVTLRVEAPDSLWLRAESGPLSQVLINLLINAAQAMGQGTITVRATTRDGRGLIAVEDEGPGLPADVLPRLFEPFFTTKAPGQGTGLGLAISRHLLAQFEGELQAANRPERGAVFTVSLPLV